MAEAASGFTIFLISYSNDRDYIQKCFLKRVKHVKRL